MSDLNIPLEFASEFQVLVRISAGRVYDLGNYWDASKLPVRMAPVPGRSHVLAGDEPGAPPQAGKAQHANATRRWRRSGFRFCKNRYRAR